MGNNLFHRELLSVVDTPVFYTFKIESSQRGDSCNIFDPPTHTESRHIARHTAQPAIAAMGGQVHVQPRRLLYITIPKN
jgi:hypothetical protein